MRIVFDASSLISISQTCLVKILPELMEKINADFFIGQAVFNETVSRPLGIKRFALNAVRLNELVEQGHIKVQELDVPSKEFAEKIGHLANSLFFLRHKPIRIMHAGEIEALALAGQLNAEALVVDERTTRMLIENPLALHSLMERKYRKKIREDRKSINELKNLFSSFSVLRSVELIALAFEMGALAGQIEKTKKTLEAALYAAKFAGCSVSFSEINNFVRGV